MANTMSELDAQQLAEYASRVFVYEGRHQEGARLIYRALELDPHHPTALRCLSDFLDIEGVQHLSAVTLVYALAPSTGLSGEARRELDDLLFFAQWTWGFSTHKSGEPSLSQEAFHDRSAFQVDTERWNAFLARATGPDQSLEDGFQAARTLCGVLAGFLNHHDQSKEIGEVFHPERFEQTPDYGSWLQTSPQKFEELGAPHQTA